jgi:hypothetical protein
MFAEFLRLERFKNGQNSQSLKNAANDNFIENTGFGIAENELLDIS